MSGDAPKTEAAEGKPKGKKMVAIGVGVAVLLVVGGAGAVLAPKFMAPPKAEKAHKEKGEHESADGESEEEGESKEHESESEESEEEDEEGSSKKHSGKEEPPLSVEWPPLVVDVRDEGGAAHHLKMVVTIECKDEHGLKATQGSSHRARAKVLEFIRSQSYEELTDGSKFGQLQTKVAKLVKQAAGKPAKEVWITDFVAQ